MDLTEDKHVVSTRTIRQLRNRGIVVADSKPKTAIKRKKDSQLTSVNASEEEKCQPTNDEGSPEKVQKLHDSDSAGDGPENNMVQMDHIEYEGQDQDMCSEEEDEDHDAVKTTKYIKGDFKMQHVENLSEERKMFLLGAQSLHENHLEPIKLKGGGGQVFSSKKILKDTSASYKPQINRQDVLVRRSIKEYQNVMEEKAKDGESVLYQYPGTKVHRTDIYKTNNIPAEKKFTYHTNTVIKKSVIGTANSASSSQGYGISLCWWLLWVMFLLASLALGLMVYLNFPASFISNKTTGSLPSVSFVNNFAALKLIFPNQHEELWKRTKIHVMQHLNLTDPKEPVSLILTSGRGAKKTLGCLAKHLATAFSTAQNSTILNIDGTSKTDLDSDQVKLAIDNELKTAFENRAQAAVIHHFEELPPGSTLIFYRYCDHENSAYKKVFLVFTVMLPMTEIGPELSLSKVEESVHEYLQHRFVLSDREAKFNEMDVDKLSGLWSRISHLILPVAAEQRIEENGCES